MDSNNYIQLTTDFGFKYFFKNKQLVLAFLNAVLPVTLIDYKLVGTSSAPTTPTTSPKQLIGKRAKTFEDITYNPQEEAGETPSDKSIRYDFVCTTDTNDRINVEMQKAKQAFYFHRAVYYSARLISRQGEAGKTDGKSWNWRLYPTYHIGLLDFPFQGLEDIPPSCSGCWKVWSRMCIDGERCLPVLAKEDNVFNSEVLNICAISFPNFRKIMLNAAISTPLEKFTWLFANLGSAQRLPAWTQEEIFQHALDFLNRSLLKDDDKTAYERDLIAMKDEQDQLETAKREGKEEGRREGEEKGRREAEEEKDMQFIQLLFSDDLQSGVQQEVAYARVVRLFGEEKVHKALRHSQSQ